MNFKKSISLILASTAISTALSAATGAEGKPFAFGDRLESRVTVQRFDGAHFVPSGVAGQPMINDPLNVGETHTYVFKLINEQGQSMGYLGDGNEGDAPIDYIITMLPDPAGQAGLVNIMPNPGIPGPVLKVDITGHAQGVANGRIKIESTGSDMPIFVPYHIPVNNQAN